MNTQEVEKNIILRTKILCGTNACIEHNKMKLYARQAVYETLTPQVAGAIYMVFGLTLEDYVDYILRKVLEE